MIPRRLLASILLIVALGVLPGCWRFRKKPTAPTPVPEASPAPVEESRAARFRARLAPPPAATPALADPVEEKPRTPAQLQSDYLAAKEFPDRVDLIYQLGDAGTADAVFTLMRLFQAEADVDLKSEMLDAIDRIDEEIPAKLAFLAIALRPDQPADLREAAVGMLLMVNDRRAIPTWQTLLKDPDPERRETAQQQIEDLQQLDPN